MEYGTLARYIRRGLLKLSVVAYRLETALKSLTRILVSASRMEFFRTRMGSRKPSVKIFIEQPSRLFLIPDLSQLEKIYLILTSMHYEVVEQGIEPTGFHLSAQFENKNRTIQPFKEIGVSIKGVLLENKRWQVTVLFQTSEVLTLDRAKYADLVLENLTLAFGWQNFWIIECPAPVSLAA